MTQQIENASKLCAPSGIASIDGGTQLWIAWPDGREAEIAADLLWRECPSAAGKRRRMDGRDNPPADIAITGLKPIGGYGVNLTFSDGHDRGIYAWAYLAELASRPSVADFLIPKSA